MRLIVFFLLLSFSSEAQIIRANPFYVGRVAAVGGGFLLDDYPNAAAAYSLRKLKSSYTGNAIRVRIDSTGNAETDIGFDGNGELDTVALKNHCRNNSCMVTTWYSQGDSDAVNFTQTTAASQPRIMTTGTIERRSGKPTIRFDVSGTSDFMDVESSTVKFNYLHKAGQAAVFMTFQAGVNTNPGAQYAILDNESFTALTSHGFSLVYNDGTLNNAIRSASTRSASPATSVQSPADFFAADTLALLTNLLNNSTATAADRNILYYNGGNEKKLNTSTATASVQNATFNFRLGRRAGGTDFNLNGFVSELILYPTDQTSNRTGIETNIINYFGL
jgi:hypothetical protein